MKTKLKLVRDVQAATASAGCPKFVNREASELSTLQPVSVEDVIKAIKSASSKQCATDPLPTWLLKDSIAVLCSTLAPYITSLFNTSLTNGYFSTQWKNANVKPLIKKAELDETLSSKYRPVSKLPFLSKVLDRIVHRQLTNHLNRHNVLPDVQSAYRKRFSTETAVLKVYSDIIDAMSNEKMVLLSLLDLTEAFDTVDHDVLLQRWKRHSVSAALCFSGSVLTLATDLRDLYWGHFFLHYIQLT